MPRFSGDILRFFFVVHDRTADFLAYHIYAVKRTLLVAAWGGFLFILFPDMRRDMGELSFDILFLLMTVSPLSRLLRMRLLYLVMAVRRELGILMAAYALVHSLGYLLDPMWTAWYVSPYWPDLAAMEWRILFGFVAMFLTLPLFLTSNALSQRLLGRNWKRVHWLAYPLLLFAVLHKFVRSDADLFGFFSAGAVFVSYIALRILAAGNFLPPLRMAITWVAERYAAFRSTSVAQGAADGRQQL